MRLIIALILLSLTSAAVAQMPWSSFMSGTPLPLPSPSPPPPPPPNNVACDYGPNTILPTGTAGTDLQTAWGSSLHCILNADFTDNSGVVVNSGPGNPQTWVMNNPSTWLNECTSGGVTNTPWKFWFMWNIGSSGSADGSHAPCSRIGLTTDGGSQVLTWQFASSDVINGSQQGLSLHWPLCGNWCNDRSIFGPNLPYAVYTEITYRMAPNSLTQAGGHIALSAELLEDTNNPGFHNTAGFLDPVFIEAGPVDANNGQTESSWDNYTGTIGKVTDGYHWHFNYGSYHTYAWLFTVNGTGTTATAMDVCGYTDGSLTVNDGSAGTEDNCAHYPGFTDTEISWHDAKFDITTGDFCSCTVSPSDMSNTQVMYLKSWRIFSCNTPYGSGNDCPGTLVYHQ